MRRTILPIVAAGLLASCGQSGNDAANGTAVKPAAPKKKVPYCFFKDEEMKGWSAKRGKDGNVTVMGEVYREDGRYQAILKPAVVTGNRAEISPDLQQNAGQYSAPDNWWDVTETIPNSAAVETVDVTCGGKTIASFTLKPSKG